MRQNVANKNLLGSFRQYTSYGNIQRLLRNSTLNRVSTTPGNTGNLEFEIPPGNTGNLLDFC